MQINSVSDFRRAMRNGKYAWPGAYPCFFIADDGAVISFESAKENRRQIIDSIANQHNDGWRIIALDINWEDSELFCAHSGLRIESAYTEND
jgi:hypothetical protein